MEFTVLFSVIQFLCFYVLFVQCGLLETERFVPYQQEWTVNASALSVANIVYNPSSRTSPWVRRLLGEEAIFHNRSHTSMAGAPLRSREKYERSKLFSEFFHLPHEARLPSCSFEFLTYGLVDYDHPLSHYYMYTAPSVGKASLYFYDSTNSDTVVDEWTCYYRGTYEFTSRRIVVLPQTHWPVFVYCPAPRYDDSCIALLKRYQDSVRSNVNAEGRYTSSRATIKAMLRMKLMHSAWDVSPLFLDLQNLVRRSQLSIWRQRIAAQEAARSTKTISTASIDEPDIKRAVCTVIPYTATHSGRHGVSQAMLFDFLRYYTRLGFRVMIFDSFGANREAVESSAYARAQRDNWTIATAPVDYREYTALQRLSPNMRQNYADAVDSNVLSKVIVRGDVDKRLTYTHCRFELLHLYGIEDVLVVDFDEFIYCPNAGPTAAEQREFIDSYLEHMKQSGVEQLVLKQRVLVPRISGEHSTPAVAPEQGPSGQLGADGARNMTSCLLEQVLRAQRPEKDLPPPNLFLCLGSFQFAVKVFFEKTVHFGLVCPFTSYHSASHLRLYDCHAQSFLSAARVGKQYHKGGCSVIHVTTRVQHYNRTLPNFNFAQAEAAGPCEVVEILRESSSWPSTNVQDRSTVASSAPRKQLLPSLEMDTEEDPELFDGQLSLRRKMKLRPGGSKQRAARRNSQSMSLSQIL